MKHKLNNFLHIQDFDSLKYGNEDYGFSFIGGNILFIVLPFEEIPEGYLVRGFEYQTDTCFETNVKVDKEVFLVSSINELGEIVKLCDFKLEDRNDSNTKKTQVLKKQDFFVCLFLIIL